MRGWTWLPTCPRPLNLGMLTTLGALRDTKRWLKKSNSREEVGE